MLINFLVSLFAVFRPTSVVAKVVVPLLDNNKQSLASVVEATIASMAKTFGGCTVYEAEGYWYDPKTGILYPAEPVKVVEAASEIGRKRSRQGVEAIARQIMADSDQLAVFTQVAGQPRIIDRE